jgi:hypothetical protein
MTWPDASAYCKSNFPGGELRAWASLPLSAAVHLHVLNDSYDRTYLCACSVEMGTDRPAHG